MVSGVAGIFGGNVRTAPVKAAPARNSNSTFAPALRQAVAAKATVSQKNVTVNAKTSALRDSFLPSLRILSATRPTSVKTLASVDTDASINTPSSTGLTLTNGLPTVTVPTGQTSATPAATPSVIDTLKAALVASGVDISQMQFNQHRDLVTYPTGSYINDIISFKASSGQTHEYMTDLVAAAPQVTVNEIQQLLAGNRG